jgi:hypothetical protein
MINAQSGLIDATGQRIVRVPDTGTQFFIVSVTPASTMNHENEKSK